MKVSALVKKLESDSEFEKFKKENPKAFLSSIFIVFDFESGGNQQDMNYFIPSEKKIAVFAVSDSGIMEKTSNLFDEEKSEKFHELKFDGLKLDADDIEKNVQNQLKKEKITNKLNKIIAVLQPCDEGKDVLWNLTCILDGLVIVRINIDACNGKLLKFEKAGLMDFIKFEKGKEK
ncbi:hypothetical protein COS75_02535 [Candidatus Pacearchaeota archaeon CG06_land_8_20_14_3_00_35_12]|nr:MAG: hypothetical protein COS75_02535 [Candidatus Pacearchaeota archaeon CG06_land_8_20_14_3_00_35_12]